MMKYSLCHKNIELLPLFVFKWYNFFENGVKKFLYDEP